MTCDLGKLHTVPADRRCAKDQRDHCDRGRRPRRRCQGDDDATDRGDDADDAEHATWRRNAIGDESPSDTADHTAHGRSGQHKPGTDERPPKRFGQINDDEARQANLGARIDERNDRQLGERSRSHDDAQRLQHSRQRKSAGGMARGLQLSVQHGMGLLCDRGNHKARKRRNQQRNAPPDDERESRQHRARECGSRRHAGLLDRERQRKAVRLCSSYQHVR